MSSAQIPKTADEYLPALDDEEVLFNNSVPFFNPSNKSADKNSDLLIPTTGYNWGILHGNNAVDIANICGTPVYAAEDGFIIKATEGGWNDGYGNYVEMEHPAKIQTLYAHLDKVVVSLGKYVEKGTLIGYMGATGDVSGVTGCHLHFEVHGAKNPFVK